MQQALKQNSMHQQLLQHMIEQQDLEIYDLMLQVCNIYSFYYYYFIIIIIIIPYVRTCVC
jgi:hypothetical protein